MRVRPGTNCRERGGGEVEGEEVEEDMARKGRRSGAREEERLLREAERSEGVSGSRAEAAAAQSMGAEGQPERRQRDGRMSAGRSTAEGRGR